MGKKSASSARSWNGGTETRRPTALSPRCCGKSRGNRIGPDDSPGRHAMGEKIPTRLLFGCPAAVYANAVLAGSMASISGSASVTPAHCRKVPRGKCFLVMNDIVSSLPDPSPWVQPRNDGRHCRRTQPGPVSGPDCIWGARSRQRKTRPAESGIYDSKRPVPGRPGVFR